jgi:hypothetical protein
MTKIENDQKKGVNDMNGCVVYDSYAIITGCDKISQHFQS